MNWSKYKNWKMWVILVPGLLALAFFLLMRFLAKISWKSYMFFSKLDGDCDTPSWLQRILDWVDK